MRTLFLSAVLLVACTQKVSMSDARVAPLLNAMNAVDRGSLGFSPVERDAEVRLECGGGRGYDAMLHIGGTTSRTIAFVKRGNEYAWVGEQEIFEGPAMFDTPDGRIREHIVITYETVPMSGAPLNTVYVTYEGDDPRLAWPKKLSLAEVAPILREWSKRRR